jgi:PIN domain nuclease of toxin-antitoxin system
LVGVVLDTHAAIWLLNGESMSADALEAIAQAQLDGKLFLSPITAWEAALALTKRGGRPDLGNRDGATWFRAARQLPGAALVPIGPVIAFEAARVPVRYGRGDPGDCFIIATARMKRVPIVTRDRAMIDLAERDPDYLAVVVC